MVTAGCWGGRPVSGGFASLERAFAVVVGTGECGDAETAGGLGGWTGSCRPGEGHGRRDVGAGAALDAGEATEGRGRGGPAVETAFV
jgi:hypothetical protein